MQAACLRKRRLYFCRALNSVQKFKIKIKKTTYSGGCPFLGILSNGTCTLMQIESGHHSKKFLHGKIFICMLHRGHLQENIAEFLICTQLGLIRDVTSLVNEIT